MAQHPAGKDGADQRRDENDERKGRCEEEQRREGRGGEPDLEARVERALADPDQRLDDDRQHRRLHAQEQRREPAEIGGVGVEDRQPENDRRAGDHEEQPRRQSAAAPVQPPADIGRELLRLRPRQQMAEIESAQIGALADPALLLHDFAMHQRDLARRSAEAQAADLGEFADHLGKARRHARVPCSGDEAGEAQRLGGGRLTGRSRRPGNGHVRCLPPDMLEAVHHRTRSQAFS